LRLGDLARVAVAYHGHSRGSGHGWNLSPLVPGLAVFIVPTCIKWEAGPRQPNYLLDPASQVGSMSQFAGVFQHAEGEGQRHALPGAKRPPPSSPIRMNATSRAICPLVRGEPEATGDVYGPRRSLRCATTLVCGWAWQHHRPSRGYKPMGGCVPHLGRLVSSGEC